MIKPMWVASAAFFVALLTIETTSARGLCVPPEVEIALIGHNYPGMVAHAMSDAEFAAFAESVLLNSGDAAFWFERPGARSVRVVIFEDGCRIDVGEVDRDALPGLMGSPET